MPEPYGPRTASAKVLISSALSGGSLAQRLQEAVERYGADRAVLAVERVAADFFLPSPDGQGRPLTGNNSAPCWKRRAPPCSSPPSCAPTILPICPGENGAHFVLFDDAGSIRKKLRLAWYAGIRQAVLSYPQVDDLLEEILRDL